MLHDDYSQGLDQTLTLVRERFYWSTMYQYVPEYVTNCHCFHVTRGRYTGSHTQQGLLVADNPLDLLCIDFLKGDPSKDSKENVTTDAFSKFSQAFVTNNQNILTVAKILVDKWFYVCGILTQIHSDKGQNYKNDIISDLYSMYNIKQCLTMPYNPNENSICERFSHTLLDLIKTLPKEQKANWALHILSLVFAYNAMPHSMTSYQPCELMFQC